MAALYNRDRYFLQGSCALSSSCVDLEGLQDLDIDGVRLTALDEYAMTMVPCSRCWFSQRKRTSTSVLTFLNSMGQWCFLWDGKGCKIVRGFCSPGERWAHNSRWIAVGQNYTSRTVSTREPLAHKGWHLPNFRMLSCVCN